MTVASISTVVFNGNPLMRYDGYYVLSDLAEAPNLAERSGEVLRYYAARLLLGAEEGAGPAVPVHRHGWYATYAVCSTVYRWIVTISIILFLVAAARPYRLENGARLLGLAGVMSLFMGPFMRLKRLVTKPGGLRRMRARRAVWSGLIGALLLGLLLFVPLRLRIFGGPRSWEGNIGFNDGRVIFSNRPDPDSLPVTYPTPINGQRTIPDNVFVNEDFDGVPVGDQFADYGDNAYLKLYGDVFVVPSGVAITPYID